MKADDMRTVLSFHEDSLHENTIVEDYLKGRGHFLPKFHCKLNPIECVWAQAKVYCRAYKSFTLNWLQQIIDPALDSVTVDNIRKFARKSRDYERAYREGLKAGKEVDNAVKNINHIEGSSRRSPRLKHFVQHTLSTFYQMFLAVLWAL